MTEIEFQAWPKTPRLFADVVISEKIDGTNACVIVTDDGRVAAQSRTRLITPEQDNHGFASWVRDNSEELAAILGPGHHFGEWWGYKIQRGYGCKKGERYFSLFNTAKWGHFKDEPPSLPGLTVVPVLYEGVFAEAEINSAILELLIDGSKARPGFMRPEGVCVFHKASGRVFKVILDK